MVQWLGLGPFTAVSQVRALVGELRSPKPCQKEREGGKKRERKMGEGSQDLMLTTAPGKEVHLR